MNSVVRQLWEQNTDIVMVDTGNSYEGLCEYVGGKYIAYTEDKPITMNPFNISKRELNIEKIDFLKNLILLIWKGSETQIPELEFRVVEQLVTEYYDFYFNGVQPYPSSQKETLRKNLSTMEKRRGTELTQIHDKVEKLIKGLEERRMALSVKTLSFDSFYEFACERLDQICIENNITTIDCDNFAYMLQNFYRGGKYDKILNENVDSTLFDETFIVFEVDAIKENKQLFPIDAHHHGRVPAEDAPEEEPQVPCHRGGMESHRLAADGRVHQVPIQDSPKVLGERGRSDTGDTGHHRQSHREGSHHQQLGCGDAARPKQIS